MIFSQYFGNYLLEQRLLTAAQLREALTRQSGAHAKLGVLAMDAQFMTAGQVNEVSIAQRMQDCKFGEIAVKKGYLTRLQLDALLHKQTPEHVLLSQALIDMGLFSYESLEKAMESYRVAEGFSMDEFESIMRGGTEKLVGAALGINDDGYARIRQYASVFAKNIVRFIDPEARLGRARIVDHIEYDWLASQGIEGELSLFTAISAEEAPFLELAGKFAGMRIGTMGELACASVSELLNCNNGIFGSNLHDEGVTVDLMLPEVTRDGRITSKGSLFSIPVCLGFGKLELVIADFYAPYEQR